MRNLIKPVLLLKKTFLLATKSDQIPSFEEAGSSPGELWISNDRDDQLGQKSKPKNPHSFQ